MNYRYGTDTNPLGALMAEIIVKAVSVTHADPEKDRRGCYKRGYPVAVYPDGTRWGACECLPRFVIIKLPGVAVDHPTLVKYIQPEHEDTPDADGNYPTYRRRRWQIRWADLPTAARNRLQNDGELIIKAGSYGGAFDYTWAQVKAYFRDLKTGLDETGDL